MKTPPPRAQGGPAILAALRDDIGSGKLAPGAVLRQAELAEQFGTSRIPVREALNSLQAEGLVQIEPNRGAYVTTLGADELHELFDLRVLLETDVLRRAVPLHTERSLRRLEAIQHELDGETAPLEWLRLDRAFHDELYAPGRRLRSQQMVASLRASVERFYLAQLGPEARRSGWNDEHQRLIALVRAGDPDGACAMLAQHLRETEKLAVSTLGSLI
ncbi:GntR family transcriptional regulator [Pseudoduganella sp. R-43]|uniref:GntR family transcriptional regulator n=1 Tax=Pseudoduganella sp. R-43 TaxID=3404063 RepID=UPI003CEB82A8